MLFRQLGRSIGSPHFQVAERALFLWHNEYFCNLIQQHTPEVLKIIYPVLKTNSSSHWNPTVNNLSTSVIDTLREMNAECVEEVSCFCCAVRGRVGFCKCDACLSLACHSHLASV